MMRHASSLATLVLLATVMIAPGGAVADEARKCIYPRGGLAPAVGPWPCDPKRPHSVEIDRRATFRPHPLSRHSDRTNFGLAADQGAPPYAAAVAFDAALSPRSSAPQEAWIEEIEAP